MELRADVYITGASGLDHGDLALDVTVANHFVQARVHQGAPYGAAAASLAEKFQTLALKGSLPFLRYKAYSNRH